MLFSFKQVLVALLIINKISSLEAHILSRQYSHDNLFPELTPRFTFLSFVGFIVIVGAIIFCYCYFKNSFGNRASNERIVVPNNNFIQSNNVPVPVAPVSQNNQMLDYFRQQPQKIQNQRVQMNKKVQTTNPYLTKLDSHGVALWIPVTNSKEHHKIGKEGCNICGQLLKDGQPSNVIINCSSDHCFHLSCLGQYRTKRFDMGGNGVDRCPKCKDSYSAIIKIYCPSCMEKLHQINLIDYTGADDKLNINSIYEKYGRLCEKCS